MADTIITNTPDKSDSGDGVMGGVVLAIIIAALVVGGVILYQRGGFQTAADPDTTEINVTLPAPTPAPSE